MGFTVGLWEGIWGSGVETGEYWALAPEPKLTLLEPQALLLERVLDHKP